MQGANTYTFAYNGIGDRMRQVAGGITTTYTLDLNAGLTQVLADVANGATNTYLYGNGRIAQYTGTTPAYFLGDALGSVRQLANASGAVTLARSYEPFGSVMSSAGTGTTSYAFTGEWQDATNLLHLRARYLSVQTGRFLTRDVWAGDYRRPISFNAWLYVGDRPVNLTDPTGLAPSWSGPLAFAMCFDLHSLTSGLPQAAIGLGATTAQQAVDICRTAYSMEAWSDWSFGLDKDLPTSAHELMGWYLFEIGKDHLYFDGKQPLTVELAQTSLINDIRNWYYTGGDVIKPIQYKFNHLEYIATLGLDSRHSIFKGSLPISFFLGSFYYQVRSTYDRGGPRVGFRIDNDTTLESGTHFVGRYAEQGFEGSVERLIERDSSLANMSLYQLIHDEASGGSKLISILTPGSREETKYPLGAGNLYQTFAWSEKYDPCLAGLIPQKVFAFMLDIQVWDNYDSYTQDPYRR